MGANIYNSADLVNLKIVKKQNLKININSSEFSQYAYNELNDLAHEINESDFITWMSNIYGKDIPTNAYSKLYSILKKKIRIKQKFKFLSKDSNKLKGHLGGYDYTEDITLLDKDFVEKATYSLEESLELWVIVVEEFGHQIDNYLRNKYSDVGGNAPLDEGANFAYYILKRHFDHNSIVEFARSKDDFIYFVDYENTSFCLDVWLRERTRKTDQKSRSISFHHEFLPWSYVLGRMKGLKFKYLTNAKDPKAIVEIIDWPSDTFDVKVKYKSTKITVKKYDLEPLRKSIDGIRYYIASNTRGSISHQAQRKYVYSTLKRINALKKLIKKHEATKSQYKSKPKIWKKQLDNLNLQLLNPIPAGLTRSQARTWRRNNPVGLVDKLEKQVINSYERLIVRETMFNRFDHYIKKWVDLYYSNFDLKPKFILNAKPNRLQIKLYNIIKSMIYEESRMGTWGHYLSLPPYSYCLGDSYDPDTHDPDSTPQNLMQSIDSLQFQQYIMIKEMSPPIYTKYKLSDWQKRHIWKEKTISDFLGCSGGAPVGIGYKAMSELWRKRKTNGKNLLGELSVDLNHDYQFWIRTGIRWLFNKYEHPKVKTWSKAVWWYNTGNAIGKKYRNKVFKRVGTTSDIKVAGL